MTDKARELLERALESFDYNGVVNDFVLEEIRAFLADTNPSETINNPEVDRSGAKQDEPVAYLYDLDAYCDHRPEQDVLARKIPKGIPSEYLKNVRPLYLHPTPRPEFVRLSDEEIFNLYNEHEEETSVHSTIFHFNEFARAIEARVLQRKPLKKEQIEKGFQETEYREGESRGRCFVLGVRFAEKHHGIGGGDD